MTIEPFFFQENLIILANIYQLSVMGMIYMMDKICKVFILMVTTSTTWKKIVKKKIHTHTLSLSLSHEAMNQIEVEESSPGPWESCVGMNENPCNADT
jgi:hypothetical protein